LVWILSIVEEYVFEHMRGSLSSAAAPPQVVLDALVEEIGPLERVIKNNNSS
jgi:hypothetical protein